MRFRFAPVLLVILLGAGCAQQFDATSLGVPATMASPTGQPPQGDRFKVSQTAIYMILGLVPLSRPELDKALARQLVGGKSVADLKIKVTSRWLDLLVTGITLGVVVPRTVTYEGVITGGEQPAASNP
ncbi:MAG: hypothetical protein H6R40_759 [Gemmatimonadetes bacterium]|nr:hypothetical protein [Gemmatimonadota bacterium]